MYGEVNSLKILRVSSLSVGLSFGSGHYLWGEGRSGVVNSRGGKILVACLREGGGGQNNFGITEGGGGGSKKFG